MTADIKNNTATSVAYTQLGRQLMPILPLEIHGTSIRTAFFVSDIDTDEFLEISKMIFPEFHRHRG